MTGPLKIDAPVDRSFMHMAGAALVFRGIRCVQLLFRAFQIALRSIFCLPLIAEGDDDTFLHLPEFEIRGNSHMFILEKHNLQIADIILKWIDEHGEDGGGRH